MLYELFFPLRHDAAWLGWLNVLRYVPFRTIVATVTAMLLAFILSPWFIRELQKKQIGQALKAHKPEIVAALRALQERHGKLQDAIRADQVDEAAIRAASRSMGDALADAAVLRAKIRHEIRPILTPEQRRKVDQTQEKMRDAAEGALDEFEAK